MIEFNVRGLPAPQGSKSYMGVTPSGKPKFRESSKRVKPWRSDVRDAAMRAMNEATGFGPVGEEPVLAGPVYVELVFRIPRPKSHFLPANSRRATAQLRPDAPIWPTGKPDRDKLERAVMDALTGIVFVDDAQVVSGPIEKRYADGEGPGVSVRVVDLTARNRPPRPSSQLELIPEED